MEDFLAALGLALALEGFLYALFPDKMRQMMAQVLAMPISGVRAVGLTTAIIGVGVVWLVRG
jgi:uncharacterized protein YjeT (DUF2065 family)